MRLTSGVLCRTSLLLALACGVYGTVLIGYKIPMIGWGVLVLLSWRRYHGSQRRTGGDAHGTARMATVTDLHAHGLLGRDGIIMGRAGYTEGPALGDAFRSLLTLPLRQSDAAVALFLAAFGGKKRECESIIRIRDFVHILTCAPTGRGKGVSVLAPNLLSYTGSCVVTDPKSELAGLTGEHRRRRFKHRVVRLDPFGLGGPGSAAFNPMDLMDPDSPHLIDQARDLASMLVVRTGKEHEPYWNDMAEAVLATFIAFVAACEKTPECRNLQTVRDLVCDRDKYNTALAWMKRSDACGGMLSRLAASLSWLVDRELGSVLASVQRHTNFLDSPAVAANTSASSFDPRALRTSRMTVYLCLPPDKLTSLASLQRMWIGSILRAVTMGGADETSPVLFLLDEVGNIGHIQALEDAVTLLRGYGVRLWFIFQSIGQITKCFGDRAPVFLDNIDTQQYFGINAYESADAVSKRLGDATITNESFNRTSGRSRSHGGKGQDGVNVSTGAGVTISELGRRLLKPEEIMRLPDDLAVIFHRNLPPICARLLRYYDAPEFARGGVGRPRRRGLNALLRSLSILALAAVFAAFAADLPTPAATPARRRQPYGSDQWSPYAPDEFYGGPASPSAPPGSESIPPVRRRL